MSSKYWIEQVIKKPAKAEHEGPQLRPASAHDWPKPC